VWLVSTKGEFKCQASRDYVRFEPVPFASGSCRDAYKRITYSKECAPQIDTSVYCAMDGLAPAATSDRITYPCVVKMFRRSHTKTAMHGNKDMRLLAECQTLANKFNDKLNPEKRLHFATPVLFKVTSTGWGTTPARVGTSIALGAGIPGVAFLLAPEFVVSAWFGCAALSAVAGCVTSVSPACEIDEYVCMEPNLEPSAILGGFTKLDSNSGWFRNERDADVAHAFSHWTWHATNGEIPICDLQGVAIQDGWLLTDPAAHSVKSPGLLGPTDCGPAGVETFFHRHTCNHLCKSFPKPKLKSKSAPLPAKRSSSFGWEFADASSIVHLQYGGTCYANACATVLRAAESRIVGRKVDTHDNLVKRIINKHGTNGGNTSMVLDEHCPGLCLRWQDIKGSAAEKAIERGHPILLAFWIDDFKWSAFSSFFLREPLGTLTELPEKSWSEWFSSDRQVLKGHAVVITGHCKDSWHMKNSWGDDFATKGFFKISKGCLCTMKHTFQHVFWYEKDLRASDLAAFKRRMTTIGE